VRGQQIGLMGDAAGGDEERGEALMIKLRRVGGDAEVVGAEHEHGVGRGRLVRQLVIGEDLGGEADGFRGHGG